jgi:hypothetical protein
MKTFRSLALAAMLVCGMASAVAGPVVTSGTLTRGDFEYAPTVTGNPSVDGSSLGGVYIGAMNADFDDGIFPDSFLMFCVDLFSQAGAKGVSLAYDKTDFLSPLVPFDKIGKLITFNGGLSSTSAEGSAAMQLAIWELIYDGAPGDVKSGDFSASGVTGSGTRDLANTLLAGAAGVAVSQWDVSGLSDNAFAIGGKSGYQDYITATFNFGCNEGDCGPVTQVPEPSSIALTLAGLAGIGFAASRRRKIKA